MTSSEFWCACESHGFIRIPAASIFAAGWNPRRTSIGLGLSRIPSWLKSCPAQTIAGIWTLVEQIRNRLLRSIDDLYPRWSAQGRYGTVLKAVLLGDRSSLDSETIENFRKTGLYHLLVIAGLHVGLLVLLASSLLRLFPLGEPSRRLIVLALLMFVFRFG